MEQWWKRGGGHFIVRGESMFATCSVDNELTYLFSYMLVTYLKIIPWHCVRVKLPKHEADTLVLRSIRLYGVLLTHESNIAFIPEFA
jgi:hypothetical protein